MTSMDFESEKKQRYLLTFGKSQYYCQYVGVLFHVCSEHIVCTNQNNVFTPLVYGMCAI